MKKFIFILSLIVVFFNANAQIILSPDTSVCGIYNDTLQALSQELSSINTDDIHGAVAIPLGFTFNFYGTAYNSCVLSANGYITFDITQAGQYSPWGISAPIPNPTGTMPENAIMAPWQDILPGPPPNNNITFGTTGLAPNRRFTVTWCEIPMFSCTQDLHTSQIILYEGSDKIEMFLQDKPLCATWNGGAAVQGLVDATSTNFDIVNDPLLGQPRNFPLQWTATNEGWEFIPNGTTSYIINQIPYVPIIAGTNVWTDVNGNVLGTGPSLPVNLSSSTTIYANVSGACSAGQLSDSVVISVTGCFTISTITNDASCSGNDASITCVPDTSLTNPPWNIQLLDLNGNIVQSAPNVTTFTHTFNNLFPGTYIVNVTDIFGYSSQQSATVGQIQNPISTSVNYSNVNCYNGNDGRIAVHVNNAATPFYYYLNGVLNTNPVDSVFDNLSAGFYIVSVIDDNNCLHRDTVVISAPSNPLQAIVSSKVNTCHSDSTAFAVAMGIGGTPFANGTYLYNWYDSNVGSTNPTISTNDTAFNLYTGTYFVRITDANGCDTNASVQIISPQLPLSSSNQIGPIVCKGDSSGYIVGDAGGGFPPYTYTWSTSLGGIIQQSFGLNNKDTLKNISTGVYLLDIVDQRGCQSSQISITVNEPLHPLVIDTVMLVDAIDCFGDSTGRAVVYHSGGDPSGIAPAYQYLWDNGETDSLAQHLYSGYRSCYCY